jgi:ribosome-binding protein aMBF1 (putative translation factor)
MGFWQYVQQAFHTGGAFFQVPPFFCRANLFALLPHQRVPPNKHDILKRTQNFFTLEKRRFALWPGSTQMKLFRSILLVCFLVAGFALAASAQSRSKPKNKKPAPTTTQSDLSKLRDEYIAATNNYKDSLEKLRLSYENNLKRAEDKLAVSQKLYADGLIAKTQLDEFERAVAEAKAKVAETQRQMDAAETQIASVILETRAEGQLAKNLAKGSFLRTTALIRYNGASGFSLSDSGRIQAFFAGAFKKSLPIAVFGQGAIHDRWRLDHRNAMDISLHPDSVEGQALMGFLQRNGIPFSAFRQAIPGTATGPHIHIGRPSHRY